MEKQDIKPHKWAKEIIAWANGAKIERRFSTKPEWSVVDNPTWHSKYWEFRVYDPLREVREAFDRGETIQGRLGNFSIWNDYSKSLGTINVESIKDSNGWEWREATKEEVKEFFERHLIKRYGEDWKNVKIKKCMYWGDNTRVNSGMFITEVRKDQNIWRVWNNNGCLFNEGKWAEVLEEEIEIGFDNWKICDNFGERVFRHNRTSTGNNLKWRKATKQEVLNAPNYDGSATHQDFPFEAGDKVIARWAERPKTLTVQESVGKHKFKYKECGDGSYVDAGTDTWCYATEQEINLTREVKYVPFEEEDKEQFRGKWIKRKDGDIEMKITSFGSFGGNTFLIERRSPKQLLEDFTFIDGSPFGKVK